MGRCDNCRTVIFFGGVSSAGLSFCSASCAEKAHLAVVGQTLPEREVRKHVWEVYKAACPCCGGEGPTDLRTSYRVFSLIFMTRWSSHPMVGCRRCGIKSQLLGIGFCLVLGWWGFPWGLLLTPVQVIRNLVGLLSGDDGKPSEGLDKIVRIRLAAQLAAQPPEPAAMPKPS